MAKRSLCHFVEEEMGKFPHFLLYAVLEWVLIILLFVDGFLSFVAYEFAKLFGLRAPCLFCTRIDHILVRRDRDFYFNASLCGSHKKEVSSLAYCHSHHKVSDIQRMCEACLLSFATERQSADCDTYVECFVEDDGREFQLGSDEFDEAAEAEKSGGVDDPKCSCCGEALRKKAKPSHQRKGRHCGSGGIAAVLVPAPAPSPRESRFSTRSRGRDIRVLSENELEVVGDGVISSDKLREDVKAAMVPLLAKELDDLNDDTNKSPSFIRGNKFFGIPLTDSATNSPRLVSRLSRKSPLQKAEFALEISNGSGSAADLQASPQNDADVDSILHGLNRQVRLDRKSLVALYMELDEERSASAVAANNAMAMITRLQAEKAAVQMEALQYQRMMEEQLEYDQEVLQETNDLLLKREEDVRALEAELEAYREKYGCLKEEDQDGDDHDHQETKSSKSSYSTDSVRTHIGSSCLCFSEEEANGEIFSESLKDFKEEKTYFLARKKLDKKEDLSENGVNFLESISADDEIDTRST